MLLKYARMPDIFRVSAPLVLRHNGSERVIAAHFPHPKGLLYFELYWDRGVPEHKIHLIEGNITGDGPWRVGDAVIRVLGCHGTDPALAAQYAAWQEYLQRASDYPPPPLMAAIARRFGAVV